MAEIVAVVMISVGAAYYIYQKSRNTNTVAKDSTSGSQSEIVSSAAILDPTVEKVQKPSESPTRTSAMLKSISKGRAKKTVKSNQNSTENLNVSQSSLDVVISPDLASVESQASVLDQEPKKVPSASKTVNRPPLQFDLGEMKLKQSMKKRTAE